MAAAMDPCKNAFTTRSRRRHLLELQMTKLHLTNSNPQVKTCLCSPSNHASAFRCFNHKSPKRERKPPPTPNYTSSNMILLKTAIRNSMLQKGGKEAEFAENMVIRRKPPCQHRTRPQTLQIRPSPLSIVSSALNLRFYFIILVSFMIF
ncbi:serine-rich protein [Spatholobus suberectus]|nr:serine-rich protein [Spatholobus suberectus]